MTAPSYIRVSSFPTPDFPISQATIRRWANAGRLTIFKPSGKVAVVKSTDVAAAIEGRQE